MTIRVRALFVVALLASGLPVLAADKPLKIEFRWAEAKHANGLTDDLPVRLPCPDQVVFLHKPATLTNADIAKATVRGVKVGANEVCMVEISLNAAGTKKLTEASKLNLDKPLVVQVEGKIVAAMVPKHPLTDFVPVPGNFTRAEAERIVAGIMKK